ncbi:hypothetical protein NCC49_003675 [Naganishia albida]|nr:hypothetical protein NCC49_003675 [Naganishia albida]
MSPQLVDIAIIRAHYDTLIICQSIYPDPRELTFDPETAAMMDKFLESRERDGGELALDEEMTKELRRMRALRLTVQLLIDEDFNKPLTLSVSLPLLVDDTTNGLAKLSVQAPAYLSRLDCDKIEQELASVAEDADTNGFTATDNASYIMDAAQRLILLGSELCQKAADALEEQSRKKEVVEDEGELQRVWFWFPSLSTREKRKDLVTYASRWGLTGFVLAGKPGLLCLEGSAKHAEEYMAAIKSESWGDIPSYQKKVTERYRQAIPTRAFTDMQEITHLITQHGQRGNRGDMSQVRSWMEKHGVGDAWGYVVVNGGVGGGSNS